MKGKWYAEVLGAVLLLLVGPGVWAVCTIVAPLLGVAIVAGAVVFVVLRWKLPFVTRWPGALVVPVFALLGANWYWSYIDEKHHDPIVGLIVAYLLVIGAIVVYFHSFWVDEQGDKTGIIGLGVGFTFLIALPLGFAGYDYVFHRPEKVPRVKVVSQLDVIVISRGPVPQPKLATSLVRGWGIGYYTGQAQGDGVEWSGGKPPPQGQGIDRVLLLQPDGDDGRPRNDTARWLRLARGLVARDVPTFAALRVDDAHHLRRWQTARPDGAVVAPQANGRRALVELAERLAVLSPTAGDDHTLAVRHRPHLLFDSHERLTPMDVDDIIDSHLLRLCPDKSFFLQAACKEVHSDSDIENDSNHLAFDSDAVAGLKTNSTIYVHVRHEPQRAGADIAYLDYWWYLPDNPTQAAHGALCGAGFVIAEKTCFDHQSDWEGVTVVVDAKDPDAAPREVIYAEHDASTRYVWSALQELWKGPLTALAARNAKADAAIRPLVFIARGTHASYPTACKKSHCVEPRTLLRDNHHDGVNAWVKNQDTLCLARCVTALPTRNHGNDRALWNAYDGRWGTSRCDLKFFCSSSNPPFSPGHQNRYKKPWCAKFSVLHPTVKARKDGTCVRPS
jgi:hypothetical protein